MDGGALIEAVPNFAEGRRTDVIDELAAAIQTPGVRLLHRTSDWDHNRTVLTVAGPPASVLSGLFKAVEVAIARIDLGRQRGAHPRLGAADVVPLAPVRAISLDECAVLARQLGRRIGDRLDVPVYLYAAAFGSSGPDARRPAFDPVVSAMAGAQILQAGEGNPPQDKRVSDHSAYMGVAVAALLGLQARARSGEGQCMETTMLCSAAYLFSDDFLRYGGKPPRPTPDKGQYGLGSLYRLYRAEEGWLFLAVLTDEEWSAFCQAVDHPDWRDDPRFSSKGERKAHDEELTGLLELLFKERGAQEWEELLQARDVACAVASGTWPDFLFDDWDGGDPQCTAAYSYPGIGQMRHSGMKVMLLKTPGRIGSPQVLGESTRAVLAELGYSPGQIDDLKSRNVVAWKEA